MKRISYIVVSRNDHYNGDSVGRCVNTVNHACEIISKNNFQNEFVSTLDRFSNKRLFLVNEDGELIKDKFGNITLKSPVWD